MSGQHWFLFAFGGVFSFAAAVGFLVTLRLALHRRRVLPLFLVVAVWLALMVAVSGWDGEQRRSNARRRAEELTAVQPPPAAQPDVARRAGVVARVAGPSDTPNPIFAAR